MGSEENETDSLVKTFQKSSDTIMANAATHWHLLGTREPNKNIPKSILDLTKRSDWSQLTRDGLSTFLHLLDSDGKILYASASCKAVTGYEPAELEGRSIFEFIHRDDGGVFLDELNQAVVSRNLLRSIYRFCSAQNEWIILESQGHFHLNHESKSVLSAAAVGVTCQQFFLAARPYLNQNTILLDSFLEHKMEKERLRRKVAELKQEAHGYLLESDKDNIYIGNNGTNTNPGQGLGKGFATVVACDVDFPHVGDVGIEVSKPSDGRALGGKKKTRLKIPEPRICTACGTLQSPEWRKGPKGDKTLCNACGLRWSKQMKRNMADKPVKPPY